LARRTESTQPYISEVERGIGPNGPTVATLGRILDELGEELVLKTANEWAATVAQKASEAEEWLNELLATLPPDNPRAAITLISEGLQAAKTDPFKQLLAKGAIIGLRKGISLSAGFYRERFKEMNWASKALVTAAAALSSADDRQKLEESVSLRDERVEVTRRVIERSSPDSAFQERTFEAGQESGSLGTDRDQATAISG
jgi:transcriptional regulator with XRE-family HTH domain